MIELDWIETAWAWWKEWWYVVLGGWLVLAAVVGLVVGRVIRNRDRQEPKPLPWENPGMQDMPARKEA